jgi:hypothetical protein
VVVRRRLLGCGLERGLDFHVDLCSLGHGKETFLYSYCNALIIVLPKCKRPTVRFGRLGDNAVMVRLDRLKRYRTAPIAARRRRKVT